MTRYQVYKEQCCADPRCPWINMQWMVRIVKPYPRKLSTVFRFASHAQALRFAVNLAHYETSPSQMRSWADRTAGAVDILRPNDP